MRPALGEWGTCGQGHSVEGHGPSPPKGKGACFAGQGSVELVLGLQGKRVERREGTSRPTKRFTSVTTLEERWPESELKVTI